MSTIQINRSLFLPKIKERSAGKFSQYEDNCVDLGSETLDLAQEWFDAAPWQSGVREYVMSRISFKDVDKSWFVPDFIFIWIAQKLISYVIKLIIEHYWGDMMKDMGMEL
jgi:hypothetical protein